MLSRTHSTKLAHRLNRGNIALTIFERVFFKGILMKMFKNYLIAFDQLFRFTLFLQVKN
jgi:hypothetical protein